MRLTNSTELYFTELMSDDYPSSPQASPIRPDDYEQSPVQIPLPTLSDDDSSSIIFSPEELNLFLDEIQSQVLREPENSSNGANMARTTQRYRDI